MIWLVGEIGQLYGFVFICDIVEGLMEVGFIIGCFQVELCSLIKMIGMYLVLIQLYLEVEVFVIVNVVCFEDEVVCQVVGEDLIMLEQDVFEFEEDDEEGEDGDVEVIEEVVGEEEV